MSDAKRPESREIHQVLTIHAPGRPAVHVCDDLAETAGPMVRAAMADRIRQTGRCRLALSGGSTPAPLYAWLRDHVPRAWYDQLFVTWVDERHLAEPTPHEPCDWRAFHADSNLRLAYEHWLGAVPLAPSHVLPMSFGGAIGPQVVRFGRAFLSQFNGEVDVALLGAGPDGHVASLFPGHPGLAVHDVCFAVHDSPKPPPERISLALPVLNRSAYTFVLARGADKAAMLTAAYHGDSALPLTRLTPAGALHWVLERSAALGIVAAWSAEAPRRSHDQG